MTSFADALAQIDQRHNLSIDESRMAFDAIFVGDASDDDMARFLVALADKGETVDELIGAVQSMRAKMITIKAPKHTMDIVGTGGDQTHTVNISTAVAFVVAACGVPVAKHGNRAASSRSGSSDVLRALGVNLEPELSVLEQCLYEANLCFLFAPRHHPAMRRVAEVRRRLGRRTIFNLLGPLTNPANVKRHLIGVYDLTWLGPMTEALYQLGSEVVWLAHGQDGMDEITTTAATDLVMLKHGMMNHGTLTPEEFGLPRATLADLRGENADANAAAIQALFRGAKGAYRDIVLMNAAAALTVSGKTDDMRAGLGMAGQTLDNGAALGVLERLVRLTNGIKT